MSNPKLLDQISTLPETNPAKKKLKIDFYLHLVDFYIVN